MWMKIDTKKNSFNYKYLLFNFRNKEGNSTQIIYKKKKWQNNLQLLYIYTFISESNKF